MCRAIEKLFLGPKQLSLGTIEGVGFFLSLMFLSLLWVSWKNPDYPTRSTVERESPRVLKHIPMRPIKHWTLLLYDIIH